MNATDPAVSMTEVLKLQEVNQRNTETSKQLRAQMDAHKSVIKNHMTSNKLTYIRLADDLYVSLKKKQTLPSLNDEMLAAIFRNYFIKVKQQSITEDEVDAFMEYQSSIRSRLATKKVELVISKAKPLDSLI